jgi:CheY-like chemotaxis protein
LAFSRKQMLNPKTVHVDELVDGMADMLRRTLGETVTVKTFYKDSLWPCIVDPGQLENAILNLAINSRDAMQADGTLTIETDNTVIDESISLGGDTIEPGQYVTVTISDTGSGMSGEILERVFEPFFTTKPVGEGTGLGLSMIYGFVQQSGGHVSIYSEESVGTTVTIYLPRSKKASNKKDEKMETQKAKTGQERILVLEDDPDVRELTILQLSSLGYEVLEAHDGNSALAVLREQDDIDLMLSDVVLPGGLRGPEVAEKALEFNPDLKVLFMSGYTQNALDSHPELGESSLLLNKPFRKKDLADKIRQAIDQS